MVDNMIRLLNRNQADERPEERAMTTAANSLAERTAVRCAAKGKLAGVNCPCNRYYRLASRCGRCFGDAGIHGWRQERVSIHRRRCGLRGHLRRQRSVGGTVETIWSKITAQVKAGDPIFSIDRKLNARSRFVARKQGSLPPTTQLDDSTTPSARFS